MQITELQLELSSKCNSRCVMCLKSQDRRPQGFMKPELAKRLIDETNAKRLKPSGFGEPLLSPHFKEIIEYAKWKGMYIYLITNGTLIDKEMAKFLKKNVDLLSLSIDDIRSNYEKTRVGLKWKDIIRALRYVSDHPNLRIVAVRLNQKQVERVKEYFKDKNLDIVKYVDRYKITKKIKDKITCPHNVENRLVVKHNGEVCLCCQDWFCRYKIGDLRKQPLKEIWEGQKRLNYLKILDKLPICQNCVLSSEERKKAH